VVERSDSRPFGLLRYFAGAGLAVVLVSTLAAGVASALLVRAVFAEMERDDAANLGEYFITEFAHAGYTRDVWGAGGLTREARVRALSDMRNFGLTELKLLDPEGRELQALLAPGEQPGPRWTEGFERARSGRVALRWDAVGGWQSILFSAHPAGAIESYVPVRENGTVVAIVKSRHDLEPVIAASQRSLFVIVALSGLAGFAIFGVLSLLVWRADRIIRRQHAVLAEIERRKDRFYTALSHDLRSPLVSSQAGIHLALSDLSAQLEPRQREFLADSSRSIDEVLKLIGNLLDVARVGAPGDALDKRELDLNGLLEEVVAMHRPMAAARSVAIETSIPPGIVVVGDRLKLKRVFANLLSNAIKHALGGPVRVALEKRSDGARITVHDDGAGVPVELREAVFERFARVPGTADDGAGLGLAIVREFVVSHGGQVRCESEPGHGTNFVVELPTEAPEKERLAG